MHALTLNNACARQGTDGRHFTWLTHSPWGARERRYAPDHTSALQGLLDDSLRQEIREVDAQVQALPSKAEMAQRALQR
eukprot:SAG25_NODE_563_length_6908_cov_10.085035_4_plen_79_part_00